MQRYVTLCYCNWGWGGWNNGYFNLVTMNGFDTWNSALLDLIPEIYVDPLALYEFEVNDMTIEYRTYLMRE